MLCFSPVKFYDIWRPILLLVVALA